MLKKIVENLACIPLCLFAFLVPKNKNLWVFGAWFGHQYSDNPRYIFEYIQTHHPEIQAVWLSREKSIVLQIQEMGYEAHYLRSPKGFWLSCQASIVLLSSGQDDINLVGSLNAFKVQLWHGIPLKKIKADDNNSRYSTSGPLFRIFRFVWMTIFPFEGEKWNLLVTSGSEMTQRLTSAFNGFMHSKGKIVELGNPRADCILAPPSPEVIKPFIKPFPVKRIICYAPTFRGKSSTLNLFEGFENVEQLLEKWNAILLVKLHYIDRDQVHTDNFSKRVHFVTDSELVDINPLLPHVDILITDYSSIYYDYLMLDRPLIFAPFDIDSYLTAEREFYEPYQEATPGKKCMSWNEVILELNNIFSGIDNYKVERNHQLKRFFNYLDQKNASRIIDYLKNI